MQGSSLLQDDISSMLFKVLQDEIMIIVGGRPHLD